MTEQVKVAVIGVGNNISALVQGIALHRATGSLTGIRRPVLDGLGVSDIDFVAAFATSPEKIGKDLTERRRRGDRRPGSHGGQRPAAAPRRLSRRGSAAA